MYLGAPARAARIWVYKCCCCHAARRFGSFSGRLAFMGKVVWGRLSVDFNALGAASEAFSLPPMGRLNVPFNALGAGFGSSGFPPGTSGIRSSYPDNRSAVCAKLLL